MVKQLYFFVFLILIFGKADAGPNDSNLTTREQQLQDSQQRQQEINRAGDAARPNSQTNPTRVDVSTWGLSDTQFEITNHLFGYSTILDSKNTFQGVKITGFMNIAYYQPNKNNDGDRKKGRLAVGIEFPAYKLSGRSDLFLGGGFTMIEAQSLYFDAGYEYHLLGWLKGQLGVNYNLARDPAIQASLGVTW